MVLFMKNNSTDMVSLFFKKINKKNPDEDSDFGRFITFFRKYNREKDERMRILENCLRVSSQEIKDYILEINDRDIKINHNSRLAAIGEMSASLSHELNNPLMTINNCAHLIEFSIDRNVDVLGDSLIGKEKIIESLDLIKSTVSRIKKISDSLKNLSNERSDEHSEIISVDSAISDSLVFYTEQLKNNNIRLYLDIECGNSKIDIPPSEFTQVLINLLTNAIQANIRNEENIERFIRVSASSEGGRVFISVENSGPAIGVEIREKIFDAFFTTKVIGEGTGLGLYISKRILSRRGGNIRLDHGSKLPRFIIDLPLVE